MVTRVERMRSSVPLSASSMSAPPAPAAEKRRNMTPRPEARSADIGFFLVSPRTSRTSTSTKPEPVEETEEAEDPWVPPEGASPLEESDHWRSLLTFSSRRARCSGVNWPPHRSICSMPICAMASGIEVIATFCRRPDTTWGATRSEVSTRRSSFGRPAAGPKLIGDCPKPFGRIRARGAFPDRTASSARVLS
jgi:hypothetical protein